MFNKKKLSFGILSLMALAACTNESTLPSAAINPTDDPSSQIKGNEPSNEPKNGPVATADSSHTLDQYTAQFTNDASELSFDSHVLAYNGNLPASAIIIQVSDTQAKTQLPSWPIFEITTTEVAKYFPTTAAIAGNDLNQSNCKLYTVMVNDGGQPTGHVLSKISNGTVEITSVIMGGEHAQTNNYFPVAFLVQDCEGLIDENSAITHKSYTSRIWCTNKKAKTLSELKEEFGEIDFSQIPPEALYTFDSNCEENLHNNAKTYGEWYHAKFFNF